MVKLYLFRHGESEWNKNKDSKYSAENQNAPLSPLGKIQADKMSDFLIDKNIKHIYSSPLKRAIETATILKNKIGVKIDLLDDLKEFSLYDDTCYNLTRDEIRKKLGSIDYEKMDVYKDENLDWRPLLKCETKREARERITNIINEICNTTEYDIIAISSHGRILRELLRSYNYQDDEKMYNCEVIIANYKDNFLNIESRINFEN